MSATASATPSTWWLALPWRHKRQRCPATSALRYAPFSKPQEASSRKPRQRSIGSSPGQGNGEVKASSISPPCACGLGGGATAAHNRLGLARTALYASLEPMPQWVAASTTDLAHLFGNEPPPLPASEISRWAVYALALFPIWGALFQAIASVPLAAHYVVDPRTTFDHRAWLLIYVIGNGVLGTLDERNLERGGLKIRGAAFVAALIVPV